MLLIVCGLIMISLYEIGHLSKKINCINQVVKPSNKLNKQWCEGGKRQGSSTFECSHPWNQASMISHSVVFELIYLPWRPWIESPLLLLHHLMIGRLRLDSRHPLYQRYWLHLTGLSQSIGREAFQVEWGSGVELNWWFGNWQIVWRIVNRGQEVGLHIDRALKALCWAVKSFQQTGVEGALHAAYVFGQAADEIGCMVGGIQNLWLECAPQIVGCLQAGNANTYIYIVRCLGWEIYCLDLTNYVIDLTASGKYWESNSF